MNEKKKLIRKKLLRISYVNSRYGEIGFELNFDNVLVVDPNEHSSAIKCLLESLRSESQRVFAVEAARVRSVPVVKRLLSHRFEFSDLPPVISLNDLVKSYRAQSRSEPDRTVAAKRSVAGALGLQQLLSRAAAACTAIVCHHCGAIIKQARHRLPPPWVLRSESNAAAELSNHQLLIGVLTLTSLQGPELSLLLRTFAEKGFRRFATSHLRRIEDDSREAAEVMAETLRLDSQAFGEEASRRCELGVVLERFRANELQALIDEAVRRSQEFGFERLELRALGADGELTGTAEVLQRDLINCPNCGGTVRVSTAVTPFESEQRLFVLTGRSGGGGSDSAEEKLAPVVSSGNVRSLLEVIEWVDADAHDLKLELQQLAALLSELGLADQALDTKLSELSVAQLAFLGVLVLRLHTLTDCLIVVDSPAEIFEDTQLQQLLGQLKILLELGNWILVVDESGRMKMDASAAAVAMLSLPPDWPAPAAESSGKLKKKSGKSKSNPEMTSRRKVEFSMLSAAQTEDCPTPAWLKQHYRARRVIVLRGGGSWQPEVRRGSGGRLGTVEELLLGDELAAVFSRSSLARSRNLSTAAFKRQQAEFGCRVCRGSGTLVFDEGLGTFLETTCNECLGSGLDPRALEVTVAGFSIADLREKSLSDLSALLVREAKLIERIVAAVEFGMGKTMLGEPLEFLNDQQRLRLLLAELRAQLRAKRTVRGRAAPIAASIAGPLAAGQSLLLLDRVLDGVTPTEFEEFVGVLNDFSAQGVRVVVFSERWRVED